MTEQEFLSIVSKNCPTYYKKEHKKYDYSAIRGGWEFKPPKREPSLDDCILVKWRSGGQSGGSCWDEGERHHRPIEGEQEPALEALDTILSLVAPDLTYQNYKILVKDLIEFDSWSEDEYYGNYTTYSLKKVILRKLWNKLKELNPENFS